MNTTTLWKDRIMDVGEKKVTEWVNQVLSAKSCEWSKDGTAELKKRIEDLVSFLITSLDLPTKKDLDDMNHRLEMLNGKLVSLSLKVEKILEGEAKKGSARKKVSGKKAEASAEKP